jgi:hypothetical protein
VQSSSPPPDPVSSPFAPCVPRPSFTLPKPCVHASLSDIVKDGITCKNAFDGQAVDKIAYVIKTTDRNLALLLGRALDTQMYFHAITYDHRLRDPQSDVYQFLTRIGSPFHSGELPPPPVTSPGSHGTTTPTHNTHTGSPSNEASNESDPGKHQDATATVPASLMPMLMRTGQRTCLAYCLQGYLHS